VLHHVDASLPATDGDRDEPLPGPGRQALPLQSSGSEKIVRGRNTTSAGDDGTYETAS
jgi:hypothetical protein